MVTEQVAQLLEHVVRGKDGAAMFPGAFLDQVREAPSSIAAGAHLLGFVEMHLRVAAVLDGWGASAAAEQLLDALVPAMQKLGGQAARDCSAPLRRAPRETTKSPLVSGLVAPTSHKLGRRS